MNRLKKYYRLRVNNILQKLKRNIKFLVKACISMILIYMLLKNIEIKPFMEGIVHVGWKLYVFSFVCYVITILLGALKWRLLLSKVSLKVLIITSFKAQFYSTVLPGQLFGEASKVMNLHKEKVADAEITASVIVDKITSFMAVFLIGIIGIINTQIALPKSFIIFFPIMYIIMIGILLFPRIKFLDVFILYVIEKLSNMKISFNKNYISSIMSLYNTWKKYVFSKKIVIDSIILGVIIQGIGVFQQWGLSLKTGLSISIYEFMWIFPAISIVLLLPVSLGGLGVREISLVGFLSLFAVSKEEALVISIITLSSQIFSALIGAGLIINEYINTLITNNRQKKGKTSF